MGSYYAQGATDPTGTITDIRLLRQQRRAIPTQETVGAQRTDRIKIMD